MKNAFTMIEVIFVIVIIGILSSVAIPMFSSNRNDAVGARLALSLAQCVEVSGGMYMKDQSFDLSSPACNDVTVGHNCFGLTPDDASGVLNVKNTVTSNKACIEAQRIATENRMSDSGAGIDHKF
jgi:prepilin-type N-terminal cleavage/methylation domain-containing protein